MGKKLILLFLILIFAFSSCSSDTKEPTDINEGGETETTDAYTVKFEIPTGSDLVVSVSEVSPIKVTFAFVDTANAPINASEASVTVYDTQDLSEDGNVINATSETKVVYAKTSTGIISATGEEQVNFVVSTTFPVGWTFKEVKCDDTDNYKNLKNGSETGGSEMYYRITKITGDITIKIVYQALT